MNPTTNGPRFLAYDRALEAVRLVRPLLERIRCGHRGLADQVVRAATSVVLNIGEGSQRRGADRMHFYRIAAGSAAEVRCALDAAEALGFIKGAEGAAVWDRFGEVIAMLRAITR